MVRWEKVVYAGEGGWIGSVWSDGEALVWDGDAIEGECGNVTIDP